MHNKSARFIVFLFDVIAFATAFFLSGALAEYISHDLLGNIYVEFNSPQVKQRAISFFVIASAALFTFYNRGHYKRRIPLWSQIRYIAITLIILMLVDGFMYFASKYHFSRLWIVLVWVLSFAFIIIGRNLAKSLCKALQIWNVPTVIVGDSDNIVETLYAIYSDSFTGYEVKSIIMHDGYAKFDRKVLPLAYENIEIIDGSKDYSSYLAARADNFYIIAPNSFKNFNIDDLVEKINGRSAGYALVPPIAGVNLYGSAPQYFFGHDVMFLLSRDNIHSPFGLIIKRTLDIIGSIVGLVMLLPIFAFVIYMIKKDGGSAFFGHKRIGLNNKIFKCWKFRSMAMDAEERLKTLLANDAKAKEMWDKHHKLMDDPRITKIGHFIRKTSLDEFPQLWNVLKGEMSLVGPRPIVEDEKKHYGDKINDYLSVKPGITGLWQVSGRNDTSYSHRVYLDSWYVQNWSVWCDVVILVKTVITLIKREGVY